MSIALEDRLKLLIPAALYYPYKIAKERRRREPELSVLRDLVPGHGTAIDVGANRGIYSYALSRIVERIEAFEPNPFLAAFLRWKLAPRVRVHEIALSNVTGSGDLIVPQDEKGADEHLLGHLRAGTSIAGSPPSGRVFQVPVRRLDDFDFDNVVFIKIDTEAGDLAVIEGASQTISKHRPNLLVELLAGGYANPGEEIDRLKRALGYDAWIVVGGRRWDAQQALAGEAGAVRTYNVLFTPR